VLGEPFSIRCPAFITRPSAVLLFAVTARMAGPDLLERLSLLCFDLYQNAAPREAGDAPIRVVDY
jgi:CHASE2 domain-containing sensor protein